MGKQWKQCQTLLFGAPKSLQMVTAAMKLEDAYSLASLVAQRLKRLPLMWETWVRSLGQEDPLEKEMATHSSILAWRIPWIGGAWWATVHGVAKSWTRLSDLTFNFQLSSLEEKL